MTELEAVNTILATIGEAGVSSLSSDAGAITDSAMAQKTLKEVSTDVQAEGWTWNTDNNVEIAPNAQDVYVLPAGTLSVQFSPNQYPQGQYVLRGLRIYDRQLQKFDFANDIGQAKLYAANRIGLLMDSSTPPQADWSQIPHAAQQYITIRAARIFSDRYVASSVVFTYTTADEDQARTMLIRSEESTLNNNLLWGNDRGNGQGIGYIPAAGTRYRFH